MPLTKWKIEPSRLLERSAAAEQGRDLTDFISLMMSSVIRQLSCVCRHADDIFSELVADANLLTVRSAQLDRRVSLLQQYTGHLTPADDEEGTFLLQLLSIKMGKVKEVDLYSAFIVVPHIQGAQVQITQVYVQITPYLPLPRKHSPDDASPD